MKASIYVTTNTVGYTKETGTFTVDSKEHNKPFYPKIGVAYAITSASVISLGFSNHLTIKNPSAVTLLAQPEVNHDRGIMQVTTPAVWAIG